MSSVYQCTCICSAFVENLDLVGNEFEFEVEVVSIYDNEELDIKFHQGKFFRTTQNHVNISETSVN